MYTKRVSSYPKNEEKGERKVTDNIKEFGKWFLKNTL